MTLKRYSKGKIELINGNLRLNLNKNTYAFDEKGDGSLDKICFLGYGRIPPLNREPTNEEQDLYREIRNF